MSDIGMLISAPEAGQCYGCDRDYQAGDRISVTDAGSIYEGRFHVACEPAQRDAAVAAGLPDPWGKLEETLCATCGASPCLPKCPALLAQADGQAA